MTPVVYKIGDWEQVAHLVTNLEHYCRMAYLECLRKWTSKAKKLAWEHIRKQDLNWEPLSAQYLADKVRAGHDHYIYLRTYDYFKAITKSVDKVNLTGHVGIKQGARNREGEDLVMIEKVLEYGSDRLGIPARPLWRPIQEEVFTWIGGNPNVQPDRVLLDIITKRGLSLSAEDATD